MLSSDSFILTFFVSGIGFPSIWLGGVVQSGQYDLLDDRYLKIQVSGLQAHHHHATTGTILVNFHLKFELPVQ